MAANLGPTPRIWIGALLPGGPTAPPHAVPSDGCFDLFHHGHANAIRQASAFGGLLVAGVHSDAEIEEHKGPPVLTLAERCAHVGACRWVDEVVPDAPYVTEVDYVRRHGVDYVVHGDDTTTDSEGNDTYRKVKAAGMYKECRRTPGISTTDAISRVLTSSMSDPVSDITSEEFQSLLVAFAIDRHCLNPILSTTARSKAANPTLFDEDRVYVLRHDFQRGCGQMVYVTGAFDGLWPGDLQRLAELAASGDHVIVGVVASEAVLRTAGKPCIFSLEERALLVMQCKHVTGVLIPASTKPEQIEALLQGRGRHVDLPLTPSPLYARIEARRPALEARQVRKLGKSALEAKLRSHAS